MSCGNCVTLPQLAHISSHSKAVDYMMSGLTCIRTRSIVKSGWRLGQSQAAGQGVAMPALDRLDSLFIVVAFLFQIALIIHFALRRWAFNTALRYGPIVYALALPAIALSLAQINAGKPWYLWLAGLLYAGWAIFGYYAEYVRHIEWRSPINWSVFVPYVTLYLATIMFYWWPLGLWSRPLWFIYAALFAVATVLNIISHHRPDKTLRMSSG